MDGGAEHELVQHRNSWIPFSAIENCENAALLKDCQQLGLQQGASASGGNRTLWRGNLLTCCCRCLRQDIMWSLLALHYLQHTLRLATVARRWDNRHSDILTGSVTCNHLVYPELPVHGQHGGTCRGVQVSVQLWAGSEHQLPLSVTRRELHSPWFTGTAAQRYLCLFRCSVGGCVCVFRCGLVFVTV